jgi:demethylmacrocin O-methyltransferase
MPAPSLTEIAERLKTDKWGGPYYTPHYERHLGHLRQHEFTLLEIGIGGYERKRGGASLKMWKRYFRKAQVVGLDLHDKSFVDRDRIVTYQGSQTDEALLRRIIDEQGAPQVVIDDGSHRPQDIRNTFAILFPLLPDGAIYAIEDLQTSYWPTFDGSLDRNDPSTSMGLIKSLIDGLNYEEFLDEDYEPTYTDRHVVAVHCFHNLAIIEKGENREGSQWRDTHLRKYQRELAERDGLNGDTSS